MNNIIRVIFKILLYIAISVCLIMLMDIAMPEVIYADSICTNNEEAFNCLKNNFTELYRGDYLLFWRILHNQAELVAECNGPNNVANFLELIRLKSHNAEFNEFFYETIENLSISNTRCLLDALLNMKEDDRYEILKMLATPLFIDSDDIFNSFVKFSDYPKYQGIIALYDNILVEINRTNNNDEKRN